MIRSSITTALLERRESEDSAESQEQEQFRTKTEEDTMILHHDLLQEKLTNQEIYEGDTHAGNCYAITGEERKCKLSHLQNNSLLHALAGSGQIENPYSERHNTNTTNGEILQRFKTFASYITFLPVGMATSILGATLLELEYQTFTTNDNIVMLFTWRGIGAICGNVIMGLLFNRMRPEPSLALATLILGLMNAIIPLCRSYAFLATAFVTSGVAIGFIGAGLNAYILRIWTERPAPYIQALHFSVSFGSMLGPLVCTPFLGWNPVGDANSTNQESELTLQDGISDLHIMDVNVTSLQRSLVESELIKRSYNDEIEAGISLGEVISHQKIVSRKEPLTNNIIGTANNLSQDVNVIPSFGKFESPLLIPYTVISIICFFAFLCYILVIILDKKKQTPQILQTQQYTSKPTIVNYENQKDRKVLKVVLLVLVCILCICSGGLEAAFGGYITSYGVLQLHMPSSTAALLATTFWGAFATGRGLGVILTQCLSPHFILIIDCVSACLAFSTFLFVSHAHITITFVLTAIVGSALSTIFANVVSYAYINLKISPRIASVFVINLYVGMMLLPTLVGYVMDVFTPLAMLYTLITVSAIAIMLLSFTHVLYSRCYKVSMKRSTHI